MNTPAPSLKAFAATCIIFGMGWSPSLLAADCPTTCEQPFAGDANLDGEITLADVTEMFALLNNSESYCLTDVDVTADGIFDQQDPKFVLAYLFSGGEEAIDQRLAGDANGDGQVDLADFTVLTEYLYADGDLECERQADVNADCTIDVADVSLMGGYFAGTTSSLRLTENCFSSSTDR